jgi:glycosyltransferase involved in cell wall biosynthesis
MKICFLLPKTYPLFNSNVEATFGGAEVQLYLLSSELAKNKEMEVHFMVADYGQKKKEIIKNVKLWRTFNFKENIFIKYFNFFIIFKKINADVYVLRSTSHAGLILLLCKLLRKKIIYMVAHDSQVDKTNELYRRKIKGFFMRSVFKYSDEIISQNEYQKDNLLKNFRRKSIILNSSYEIKENNNKREFVLWVGRSEKWKRPELFLSLAKLNRDKKFVMICPPSTNDPTVYLEVKKKTIEIDNLEFHKFVPFDKIDDYFRRAYVYISTSTKEGFQNTLVQAVKNGVPILSLNVNPNEFITKNNCGFFCKNDFVLLNKKLKEIFKNEDLFNSMCKNAYEYAKKNHDIKINAKKFIEIIKK